MNEKTCWYPDLRRRLSGPERHHPRCSKSTVRPHGDNVEIVGILNGYSGLINGDYKEMSEDDFRGILTLGGTILGTKRTPFKMMRVVEDETSIKWPP